MQKNDTTAKDSGVTRADALLLFKLITDEAGAEDARRSLLEYVDEILNASPISDLTNDRPLFLRGFTEGWPRADQHSRRNVGAILRRVKGGETVESIIADFRAELDAAVTHKPEVDASFDAAVTQQQSAELDAPEMTDEARYMSEADFLARALAHPEVPIDFTAYVAGVIIDIQDDVSLWTPEVLRVAWPLIRQQPGNGGAGLFVAVTEAFKTFADDDTRKLLGKLRWRDEK
ncbi:MAG: hypothetical protein H0W76_27315 [Pyrinomonadaceae bacterium]|nr:hypothetical protein [Pyrinomonadaceae bacterium]